MAEHSPLPWRVDSGSIVAVDGHSIVDTGIFDEIGDVDFIISACNSHDDLLAACKAVRDTCPADPDINPNWNAAWDALVAAIAKAEQ